MSKTILIVEDNPDMRSGLQVTLEFEGYDVLTANHGQEAMDVLADSMPDLILADLKMPFMDGLRLMDEIRKNETWRAIPVIVVTALAEPAIQQSAAWRGAFAVITKPFELEELLEAVEQVLGSE